MCPLRPAHAGSYVWYQSATSYSPVYTVAANGGITAMPNYVSQAYTVSQSGVSGSYTSYGGGGQCNVQCQGQLTAKFTWMPSPNKTMQSDPPPTCALVTQTSSASWSGTQGDASGSCANGLGSAVTTTNGGYSQSCSGSTYTSEPGGASFSVSCTPTASASAGPMCCTCEAGISYSATATPEIVTLPGTAVVNNAQEALAGQQVTATYSGVPSGCSVTSWAWSFKGESGINPFKNWDPKAPFDGTATQLVPFASTDINGAATAQNPNPTVNPLPLYDDTTDSLTAVCTVTIQPPTPTGGTQPAAITVAPQSQPLTFYVPAVTKFNVNPANGWAPSGFYTGTPSGPFYAQEIWDSITLNVPNPWGQVGTGCMAQIITPNRQFYRTPLNNAPAEYSKITVLNANNTESQVASPTGLDGGFPYPYGQTNTKGTGYTWTLPALGYSGDAPQQPYTYSASDNGGNNWYKSVASDSFVSWLMYQPPGSNSVWIPLQSLTWSWGGTATLNTGTGVWSVSQTSPFTSTGATSTSKYPAWTQEIPLGFTITP